MRFNPIIEVENDGLKLPEPVGSWSEKKYSLLGGYCEIFNKGIKRQFTNRVYIDLFAGAGYAAIKKKNKIIKSSSLIALSIPTPFTKYILCEKDPEKMYALQTRVNREFPEKDVLFIPGDSNLNVDLIASAIKDLGLSTISFCFVDPFSLNLHFDTIRKISQVGRVDFLILLALMMGAKRNFHNYIIDRSKVVDLFIDDHKWREPFKNKTIRKEEFISFIAKAYDDKMYKLGYKVRSEGLKPKVDADEFRLALYYLAFYSKNELGNHFFSEIQKYHIEQQTLF
jgi:three-Cys-motif partner protein